MRIERLHELLELQQNGVRHERRLRPLAGLEGVAFARGPHVKDGEVWRRHSHMGLLRLAAARLANLEGDHDFPVQPLANRAGEHARRHAQMARAHIHPSERERGRPRRGAGAPAPRRGRAGDWQAWRGQSEREQQIPRPAGQGSAASETRAVIRKATSGGGRVSNRNLLGDIRDYLKKHRDDDPEPIEVHVWYDEYYKSSTAHVIYEGERALPASLARELDSAIFDGMTIMTGVIDVQ